MKFVLICLLLFIGKIVQAQQKAPAIETVLQRSLDNVSQFESSPDNNHLFTADNEGEYRNIFWWDAMSRIILSQQRIYIGNFEAAGQLKAFNQGVCWISTNQKIMSVNLQTHTTTEIFSVLWPEYITGYDFTNAANGKLAIIVKDLGKSSGKVSDVSNKGRVIFYDTASKTIVKSFPFAEELISISNWNNATYIGTNKGKVILFDSIYNQQVIKPAGINGPVMKLVAGNDKILLVAEAKAGKAVNLNFKQCGLFQYDISSKKLHRYTLNIQVPPGYQQATKDFVPGIQAAPSSMIRDAVWDTANKRMLVAYGFNRIIAINNNDTAVIDHSPVSELEYSVGKMSWNIASNKLYLFCGNTGVFESYNQFLFYDLQQRVVAGSFKPKAPLRPINYFTIKYQDKKPYLLIHEDSLLLYDAISSEPVIVKNYMGDYSGDAWQFQLDERHDFLLAFKKYDSDGVLWKITPDWSAAFKNSYTPQQLLVINKSAATGALVKSAASVSFKKLLTEKESIQDVYTYLPQNDWWVFSVASSLALEKKRIIIAGSDGSVIKQFNIGADNNEGSIVFDDEGKYYAVTTPAGGSRDYPDNKITIYNAQTHQPVRSMKSGGYGFYPKFAANGKLYYPQVVQINGEEKTSYWMMDHADPKAMPVKISEGEQYSHHYVDTKNNLLYCGYEYDCSIINLSTGAVEKYIATDGIRNISFSPTNNWVLIQEKFRSLLCKEPGEYTSLYRFEGDHIALMNNSGAYKATEEELQNFAVKIGDKGAGYQQFDVYLNKPDEVLRAMGFSDSLPELNAMKRARLKRWQTLGISNDDHSATYLDGPQATLLNHANLPTVSTNERLTLKFNLKTTGAPLDKLLIRVNNVLEKSIAQQALENKNELLVEASIGLSNGENVVQYSVVDKKGVESIRSSSIVNYQPVNSSPAKTYLFVISTAEYGDRKFNLKYPVKDGSDLVKLFKTNLKDETVVVDSLFNQRATRDNFVALKEKLQHAGINDRVIVYFSGHGMLGKDLNFYYCTHDNDFSMPEKNGISYATILETMAASSSRNKLLLIDACHSGNLDRTAIAGQAQPDSIATINVAVEGAKGVIIPRKKAGGETINIFELMQYLFTTVDDPSGISVISASAGDSYALESDNWKNGVFTYSILNALSLQQSDVNKDNLTSINELRRYVQKTVEQLTNGAQKPASRQVNLVNDWKIW